MALIKCSKCGKEISSMATECQYCGVPMTTAIGNTHIPPPIPHKLLPNQRGKASIPPSSPQKGLISCSVCGKNISVNTKVCPHCGEPLKFEKLSTSLMKGGCALGVLGVTLPILGLIILFILFIMHNIFF